ncbi:MAG: hypothetical protein C0399_11880 [Syntrophus sp. (in: bacteria)]|nr:hypothetical protein [Syntrophus sp. (in: bacteria)]MBA4418984.1 hypothetical protein [Syntrophus sp. (in: bacteria)]
MVILAGYNKTMVTFDVTLPIAIKKKGNKYIVSCPSIDVVTQAPTEEEAKKNIGEVIRIFFESCFERGTLDQVMKECGFKVISQHKRKAVTPLKSITVPLSFSVHQHQCHV